MLFIFPVLPALAEDEPSVLVDLEPPRITIVQPLDGATLTQDRPWLEVEINDEDSGVNQDAIVISLDGVDVTAGAIIERMDLQEIGSAKMRVRYRPPVPLLRAAPVQIDVTDTRQQQPAAVVFLPSRSKTPGKLGYWPDQRPEL